MKIQVQRELSSLVNHIEKSLAEIVYNKRVTEDTHVVICEKFFFRNSSRCSLSIIMISQDLDQTIMLAIGSGGGQGIFFKQDWGSAKAYEQEVIKMLDQHKITYQILTD